MTKRRFFGTDGIRGRVGQWPITPSFAVKLGWAAGKVFAKTPGARVVIGKDTRLSGYMLESALEAGLSAAGVEVYLLGSMPTPGVAYLTRAIRAEAGIVISASHNPHYDNGIKFFSSKGAKLPDEVEAEIEAMLEQEMDTVEPELLGRAQWVQDAPGRYIEFCKASVPAFFHLKGLKIVVDCANGATYHIAPNVFRELEAEVIEVGTTPDGLNINAQVGSTAPERLQAAVIEHQADVGVALDGDGDRVIMVDSDGRLVDGDEILYILAIDSQRSGKLGHGGVVGTQMSNLGLEKALKAAGIPFERTKVGDRYVMERLHEKGWYIGGESSGHIIWLSSTTTGDGTVAALQVLAIMQKTKKSLQALLADMQKCPQAMINVKLPCPLTDEMKAAMQKAQEMGEVTLGDRGRILLRPSGTEPLVRVMVEASEKKVADEIATDVAAAVTAIVNAGHLVS